MSEILMTANLWLADEEARESYSRFLRGEIGRIENGGACPPWMSRQEAISQLEFELSRLDEEA